MVDVFDICFVVAQRVIILFYLKSLTYLGRCALYVIPNVEVPSFRGPQVIKA